MHRREIKLQPTVQFFIDNATTYSSRTVDNFIYNRRADLFFKSLIFDNCSKLHDIVLRVDSRTVQFTIVNWLIYYSKLTSSSGYIGQ